MMKSLIFSSCSFVEPHMGILLEEAAALHKAGHEVTFAYSAGMTRYCLANPHGSPLFCAFCKNRSKAWTRKWLPAGIKILPLPAQAIPPREWHYNSVADIKKIVYRGVYIGYGVMSSYTSATRDPEPVFNEINRKYFDFALDHAAYLTDRFSQLIEDEKPDTISFFTGRLIENRPLFDLAKAHGIPIRINEVLGGPRAGEEFSRIIYHNHLPHDIPYNTELLQKVWSVENESVAEKERKGRDFFERRRNGVPAGDRVYITDQKKGLLPEGWDPEKRNIVIFNSSEDEFSAVGLEFDQYAFFESQLVGIKSILEHYKDDDSYHFYVRVHPNLKRVKFPYHLDLYKLPEQYKNLTVISAWDACSTYDLLDAAEKVIVFGSTMGAEAAYWKKPVILLGGAFYYHLNICYTPKTLDELWDLIPRQLEAKDPYPAIQYGYYLLNRHLLATPIEQVDCSVIHMKFGKYTVYSCRYRKLWGSCYLLKFMTGLLGIIARKSKKIRFATPVFVDRIYKKDK